MAREFKNYKPSKECKKSVEDVVKQYENKSEDELMNEIVKNYTDSVASGALTQDELDKFVKNAKGYLNKDQYNKLLNIVKKLKNL